MKELTQAVYAGTFDVPTVGHSQIIKKACAIFDKLHIVIGTNSSKTTSFSVKERVEMIRDTLKQMHIGEDSVAVVVEVLPETQYLVDFAKDVGAKFLVRGIRDSMDFHYENQIYHTNKIIQPHVETLYLMPDETFSLVSSSWVKGLVGQGRWRSIVGQYVSPLTLEYLVNQYAEKRFRKMIEARTSGFKDVVTGGLFNGKVNGMWNNIKKMNVNDYHNINHILDCLEAIDSLLLPKNTEASDIEMAFWLHDVFPRVDDCIAYANEMMEYCPEKSCELVKTLIASTKHETCEYKTELEEIFSSIDLKILASDNNLVLDKRDYDKYVNKVEEEYLKKSGLSRDEFRGKWIEGRSDFLKKMLARKRIFAWEPFYQMYESKARENMTIELNFLEQRIEILKEYIRING